MPLVVTYWQLPEDERDLLDFLQTTGSIVALPAHWAESEKDLIPQPISVLIERDDPDQLVFGPEEHISQSAIERREFGGSTYFGTNQMKSCVACYRRGKVRSGKLAQSNLSAYLEYPTEDASKLVRKDDVFVRWIRSVTGWVREHTPERIERNGSRYRATARVKAAVEEGQLEAVLY
jgi:hypothetical protein